MKKLDDESRIANKINSDWLEDIIDNFIDLESDTSKVLNASKLLVDITMTDAGESFFNRYKQNENLPDFDEEESDLFVQSKNKSHTNSKQKPNVFGKWKKIKGLNLKKSTSRINEIQIKEKFESLKKKFQRSSQNASISKVKSPKEASPSISPSKMSSKRSFAKTKSSSQTSNSANNI